MAEIGNTVECDDSSVDDAADAESREHLRAAERVRLVACVSSESLRLAPSLSFRVRMATVGTPGSAPARRRDRRRPGRLLRLRAHPQARGDDGRGRPLRPPPHPLRAGARRRRARPPEDQVGDPRLRQDRGPRRLPLLRQREARRGHLGRRTSSATTTRSSTRSAPRPTATSASRVRTCPEAMPPPPSSAGTTPTPTTPSRVLRPLLRARGRDRQRQRRHRRRADAGADRGGAARDRHRRPRDRRPGSESDPRDRHPRSPRASPGGLHQPGAARAGRDEGRRHRRRPRRGRAGRAQPRIPRVRRGRHHDAQERRDPDRVLAAPPGGQAEARSSCASCARRSSSRATESWRR